MAKKIYLGLITLYQHTLSPDHGWPHRYFGTQVCRFHPTCSEYAKQAISEYGIWHGTVLALKRIARCHPWSDGGYDPVPSKLPRTA